MTKTNRGIVKSAKTSYTCFWTPLSCTTLMMSDAVRPLYWMVLSRVPTLSTLKASDQRQFPHPSMQMCSSCRMGQSRTHTYKHPTETEDTRHQRLDSLPFIYPRAKRQVNNKLLCLEDFGGGGGGGGTTKFLFTGAEQACCHGSRKWRSHTINWLLENSWCGSSLWLHECVCLYLCGWMLKALFSTRLNKSR